jgi:hypothetical protein
VAINHSAFTPQEIKQLIRELNDFLKRKLAEE